MIQVDIAICVPCYEKPKALIRLLDSIELQTFKNYKIYITDDSQTNCVEEAVSRYEKVTYKRNKHKLGPTANCNRAMQMGVESGAKYIKIMHHDDCFSSPDALSKMIYCMEKRQDVDFAYCDSCAVYEDKMQICQWTVEQEDAIHNDFAVLYRHNWIGAPSCIIMRNKENFSYYFDEKLVWLVDVELYMRVLYKNKNFIHIKEVLVNIYADGNNVTDYCMRQPFIIFREYWHIFLHDKYVRHGNAIKLLTVSRDKGIEAVKLRLCKEIKSKSE